MAPIHDPRTKHLDTIRLEIPYVQLGSAKALKPVLLERVGMVYEEAKKCMGCILHTINPFVFFSSNAQVGDEPC